MIQLKTDVEYVFKLAEKSGYDEPRCLAALTTVNEAIKLGHPTAKQRREWRTLEWDLWNSYSDRKDRAQAKESAQTPEARIERLEAQVTRLLAHCGLEHS